MLSFTAFYRNEKFFMLHFLIVISAPLPLCSRSGQGTRQKETRIHSPTDINDIKVDIAFPSALSDSSVPLEVRNASSRTPSKRGHAPSFNKNL
jgi:hypothetical protein